MVILSLVVLGVLFYFFGWSLYKKGQKREFIVFTLLFLLGTVYGIGTLLDQELPNPTKLIIKTHQPALELLERILPVPEE